MTEQAVYVKVLVDVSLTVAGEFGETDYLGADNKNVMYYRRWNITGPIRGQLASCIGAFNAQK